MDTSKMIPLTKMTSGKSYELLEIARNLGKVAINLRTSLESSFLRAQIIEIVEEFYNIGTVCSIYEILGGYTNHSFGLVVRENGNGSEKKNYFMRKYRLGTHEEEVKFEHALITHCIEKGFSIGADLINSENGSTYIKPHNSRAFFAIYEFLDGEDKYTWDNPDMSEKECASAGKMLAAFHDAAKDFDPRGLCREEERILEFLPTFPERFKKFAADEQTGKFHPYFLKNLDNILKSHAKVKIDEADGAKMQQNPIHNDYHPGNLKFKNNEVVGMFDFDWSKIDLRLFDVCLAINYCCGRWDDLHDGQLKLDYIQLFLKSYQETLISRHGLSPLDDIEKKNFTQMLMASNFYLINWILTSYYEKVDLNDYEYLAYLKHYVRMMGWLEDNKDEISRIPFNI